MDEEILQLVLARLQENTAAVHQLNQTIGKLLVQDKVKPPEIVENHEPAPIPTKETAPLLSPEQFDTAQAKLKQLVELYATNYKGHEEAGSQAMEFAVSKLEEATGETRLDKVAEKYFDKLIKILDKELETRKVAE